jgi:hypothetical protein
MVGRGNDMQTLIYDLDGTVIDSSHRKLVRDDGTLDLAHWKENCTPNKIFRDSLLPLARVMRQHIGEGARVIICTSRVMSEADFAFLRLHSILAPAVLHRGIGDHRGDGEYKIAKLTGYLSQRELEGAIMFDDAAEVRASVRPLGVKVLNPDPINERLA